ncbi:diazepam-binding inhibitor, partial [Danaus plexippus plexippus]
VNALRCHDAGAARGGCDLFQLISLPRNLTYLQMITKMAVT